MTKSQVFKFTHIADGTVHYGFLMVAPQENVPTFAALVYSVVFSDKGSIDQVLSDSGVPVEARFYLWSTDHTTIEEFVPLS